MVLLALRFQVNSYGNDQDRQHVKYHMVDRYNRAMFQKTFTYLQRRLPRFLIGAAAGVLILGCLAPALQAAKEPDEVKLGQQGLVELEKQYKVVKDSKLQERVDRIGQALAKIANTYEVPAHYGSSKIVPFKYTFTILDDKDVNALSMPGGFVCINKGLLDYVQSDDELAAVLAHEISHVAHHHMLALIKQQSKLNNQLAIALLASILTHAPATDMSNVMMGARFVQIAKLNGYSRQAEEDADLTGLAYLEKSKYNPVGMLTFLERLASDEMGRPEVQWGIYLTHPYTADRARIIAAKLKEAGIPIDRRAVTKAAVADVKKSAKDGVYDVWLGGKKFFTPAATDVSSEERAKSIAEHVNKLLNGGLQLRDISQSTNPPGVVARGEVILQVSQADAALDPPNAPAQVAHASYGVLYGVLLQQQLEQIY